jgi:hypothetical protein
MLTPLAQVFRIDASDNVAGGVRGTAPSRPPSRTSCRDGEVDLTPVHRAGTASHPLCLVHTLTNLSQPKEQSFVSKW